MRKDNQIEPQESEKMFALTMILTKILLLVIVVGIFWLVQLILMQSNQINAITGGFDLL